MKSAYLFLATTAVLATCKPQRSNNDIIWYPVEDEDGVFISIYGERHRTTPTAKYRSHRRARFSGQQTGPFPYPPPRHPMENEDPPFYHNINEGRPPRLFPQGPPSFQHQLDNPYPDNPFISQAMSRRPQSPQNQNYDDAEFKEILNEVFELDKHFPGQFSEKATGKPNEWGVPQSGQLIERPTDSEWLNNPEVPHIPIRPLQPNNQNPHKPNRRPNKPSRTTVDPDALVFPDQTTPKRRRTTTPSTLTPTEAPTMSPCERTCLVTPEFNPVCGTDSVTYSNAGRLKCAQMCGKDVVLSHYGNCGRSRLVTPPLSDDPRKRKRGNRRRH